MIATSIALSISIFHEWTNGGSVGLVDGNRINQLNKEKEMI